MLELVEANWPLFIIALIIRLEGKATDDIDPIVSILRLCRRAGSHPCRQQAWRVSNETN